MIISNSSKCDICNKAFNIAKSRIPTEVICEKCKQKKFVCIGRCSKKKCRCGGDFLPTTTGKGILI